MRPEDVSSPMRASSRIAAASAEARSGSTLEAATTTLSSTVMRGKTRIFWKVRAIPERAKRKAEARRMGMPIDTLPALGDRKEHTSELQSPDHLVCRLLLEKTKK